MFHVTRDEVDFITDRESEVALKTNTLTTSFQITHFSEVSTRFIKNVFQAEVDLASSEVPFGQTFRDQGPGDPRGRSGHVTPCC